MGSKVGTNGPRRVIRKESVVCSSSTRRNEPSGLDRIVAGFGAWDEVPAKPCYRCWDMPCFASSRRHSVSQLALKIEAWEKEGE